MNTTQQKDRLVFEQTTLSNGMRVYSQYDPSVNFVHASLIAPVGTAHNYGNIVPGTFHFMEHINMKRSARHPNIREAKELANLLGGSFGARTWFEQTTYELEIPSEHFQNMFEAVTSHFFHPIFVPEEIEQERGIIANERRKKSTFYPGSSEQEQYMCTKWKSDCPYPVRQIFGDDSDFEKMDARYFETLHAKWYPTSSTSLVIAGNFDLEVAVRILEQEILAKCAELIKPQYQPLAWKNKDFHTFATNEVSRLHYHVQTIYPVSNNSVVLQKVILMLIGKMLQNYNYGSLMQWLRHEKSWLYEIKVGYEVSENVINQSLMLPLNSPEQVELVRRELLGRIFDTLAKTEILEKAKQQTRNESVFWYQTVRSRMDKVMNNLHSIGTISTETEFWNALDSITCDMLRDNFSKHMLPNTGELLVVPKS